MAEVAENDASPESEEGGSGPSFLNGAIGAVLFLSGMVLGMWMIDSSSSDLLERCLALVQP